MKHASVYDGSSTRYVFVRGHVSEVFKRYGVPSTNDRTVRARAVRRERLSDVLSMLQHEGFDVRLIEGDPR